MKQQPLTTTGRVLAALSYFASILVLPIIFPLIVWLVAAHQRPVDEALVFHAKRAFQIQLAPLLIWAVAIVVILITTSVTAHIVWPQSWLAIAMFVIAGLAQLFFLICNIVMGVKVLIQKEQ